MEFVLEVYLTKSFVEKTAWLKLLNTISSYTGPLKKWQIILTIENNHFHYFLKTSRPLPATINNLDCFLFKPADPLTLPAPNFAFPHFLKPSDSLIDYLNYYEIKRQTNLKYLELNFLNLSKNFFTATANFYFAKNHVFEQSKVPILDPASLLSINFETNRRFFYKKPPKYLEIKKLLPLLSSDKNTALLSIDAFPYLNEESYLNLNNFNFNKHSIIIGSSGCGKSKFISSFIYNLYKNPELKDKYKFIVIDPHAALENEIGGLGFTVDFLETTIDLFSDHTDNITATTELLLELLESLIEGKCSPNLIRVLRHSICLLLIDHSFSFKNLRKLILELEYRTDLIEKLKHDLPVSVIDFFLSDFNNLKTKFYNEAISPIISFIDEMGMVPVFNSDETRENLKTILNNNFLTLFSLDRTKLGDKITKTLSGLIMQQLLNIVQKRELDKHIIFIIDEVAIIENPILSRYLSESRKYNLSLILASQYFNQISVPLKDAIFANVANYFIFRTSKLDAELLANNFNMKIPLDDSHEQKVNLLTGLKSRECIARLESDLDLIPAFKGVTLDFKSLPRIKTPPKTLAKEKPKTPAATSNTFDLTCNLSLHQILINNSTSRKKLLK